jgi:acyl-[acyl carrier protein]--UDP-N-acetylglucosamine O-acyltransferase
VIASSGKVKIEDNVFISFKTTILKGVTIGKNSIIGAGTVVTRDVPQNSVVSGIPGRVIYTIEEYYKKRKDQYIEEAKAFARSIKERFNRMPVPSDFKEEFPLFMKATEWRDDLPTKKQLSDSYDYYCKNHIPVYNSFEEFIEDAFQS